MDGYRTLPTATIFCLVYFLGINLNKKNIYKILTIYIK